MSKKANKIIVEDAKSLHKTFTVILGAFLAIISALELNQGLVTQLLGSFLTDEQFSIVTFIIGLLVVIGRYIKQPNR